MALAISGRSKRKASISQAMEPVGPPARLADADLDLRHLGLLECLDPAVPADSKSDGTTANRRGMCRV
jgi:hypothetical protein